MTFLVFWCHKLIPNLKILIMLFIISFIISLAVLYFLIYAEPKKNLKSFSIEKENVPELPKSETHKTSPMLNFKTFIMLDELVFLADYDENSNNTRK